MAAVNVKSISKAAIEAFIILLVLSFVGPMLASLEFALIGIALGDIIAVSVGAFVANMVTDNIKALK